MVNLIAAHPVVVEIFHSGSKWGPTDVAISGAAHMAKKVRTFMKVRAFYKNMDIFGKRDIAER